MRTRPAIVHLVLAFALASLAWGPVSVCATDDGPAACSCTTIDAPDAGASVVTVDKPATPDSRADGSTLALAAAPAGTSHPPAPAPFARGREAGTAPGAAPLFLIHCAFLC